MRNDVIGDICGVISGSASAAIAAKVTARFSFSWESVMLLLSALVAATTVGGKAIGKNFAIHSCTRIVHFAGRVIATWNRFWRFFHKKGKKGKKEEKEKDR